MGIKTKLVFAAGFVGVVAVAAAAFGQTNSSPTPNAGTRSTPRSERRAAAARQRQEGRCGRAGPRAVRRVVHGELKVKTSPGFAFVTIDTGEISAIDHAAKKITVKRLDGEVVTAVATDQTRVCKDGRASTFDALTVGDHARLVQIRSDRFTGLRRIGAITPGSEPASAGASPAGFGGDDPGGLFDQTA
jgi:uncharacterized low-complexity protein